MIQEMIREVFPSGYVTVVTGGREENEALLSEKFDYIFFTGSPKAGKSVMEKQPDISHRSFSSLAEKVRVLWMRLRI